MDHNLYVAITGLNHYYGKKPLAIGRVLRLCKEPNNAYDSEAIAATLPYIGTIGYVANSVNTVYAGTLSAGRLYDKIGEAAYGRIQFITHMSAIVQLLTQEELEAMAEAAELEDEDTNPDQDKPSDDEEAEGADDFITIQFPERLPKRSNKKKRSHTIGF